jgi:cytochrome bd ubiquinol oxidase subunit II
MAPPIDSFAQALPLIFMALMGVSMLAYVVLDGFDLGVGILMHRADAAQRDTMIASIGPFWDANETWLVLGVGIMLVAFPKAHGIVLTALYLPVAVMLIGLILRGVAFDFRVKARDVHKPLWNRAFIAGSLVAALSQGWMLGRYVTGFANGWQATLFAAAIALCLTAAYVVLGATWLVLKTEGLLQQEAVRWARWAWWPFVLGMVLISIVTPVVSASVRERWFTMPAFIGLLPIPLSTGVAMLALARVLRSPRVLGAWCWVPFALVVLVFVMGALGLAYSLYPYVVVDRMTAWQAASSPAALQVIFWGTAVTVPAIAACSVAKRRP